MILSQRETTPLAIAVVALAFILNFLGRGIAETFAAFILPLQHEFGWSRPALTGVFSVAMLTTGLAAPLAGVAFDRFGPRLVYCTGLGLLGAGALWSSRIQSLSALYVGSGLMIGIGVAFLGMVCAAALISRWYRRHLATAISVAYAGFGCGILVALPVVQSLIESDGWRAAYRMVGLFVLGLLPVCALLPWRRLAAPRKGLGGAQRDGAAVSDRDAWTVASALRSAPFWRLVQILFFTSVSIYAVSPQVVAFLIESGFTSMRAASAFGFAGMLSTAGMMSSGWLADRIGYARTALLSFVSTGLGLLALLALALSNAASLLAMLSYVLFFGIAQGARGPIVSTLSNRIFAGPHAATIYGLVYCSMAFGGATGSILGGYVQQSAGGYPAVFGLSLLALLLAAEPFVSSPVLVGRGPDPIR